MPLVTIRPHARLDIVEIWDYIAVRSEKNADALIDRLHRELQLLASRPSLGRTRDDLSTGLRSFPLERYVIFYIAIPNGIDVVRVLHSARDVGAQFKSGT